MTDPATVANRYYAAWKSKTGDFSDVPLADQLRFTGPVASFDSAAGYRQMAAQAGPAVTSFHVRHQFVDGNRVCSIIDWEMEFLPDRLSAAEVLEIEDGTIVRGELFYDGEQMRRAMTTHD